MRDYLLKNPRLDLIVAAVGLLVMVLPQITLDRGIEIAGVVAGVSGALLGMTAVVMGLYQSGGARIRALTDAHPKTISRNWSAILMHFAAASIVSLVAALSPADLVLRAGVGYGLALTAITTIRLGWFLKTYFAVSSKKTGTEQLKHESRI